jgi:aryl-alcohol dehydrogenase-like predicted oxidoreductase
MTWGNDRESWGVAKEESSRILGAFAKAGGNFLDTADYYVDGESERIVGELIASDRDRWVVGTKYVCNSRPSDPNGGGSHRKNMTQALEASLRRLRTDYVDLYWVHMWDSFTPAEEVVRALDDMVRAGKVLYVGISDTPAWIVSQCVTLADLRGWSRFVGLQVSYSLVERNVERDLLPMARALDLAVTAWAPLGHGLLTGRYRTDQPRPRDTRLAAIGGKVAARVTSERNLVIADVVNAIAAARGATASQVAISWLRAQHQRGVIIPIIGVRTRAQLDDNLKALDIGLSADDLERLDKCSSIELGFS